MLEKLTHPVNAAAATAATLLGLFQLDVIVVLLSWGWTNLGQLFYMATLLASSSALIPVSQATISKMLAGLALLLVLKLGLKAYEQVNNRIDEDS